MIGSNDKQILRQLAEEIASIASLLSHKEKAEKWRQVNDLNDSIPMLWINEIPWHEMNVNDELTIKCSDPLCRSTEWEMRTTIYQWKHMPGDMVVEPVFYSPLVIHDSGFGVQEEGELIDQSPSGGIQSHRFAPQISNEKDIEKIKCPVVSHDEKKSEYNYQLLTDTFGDILKVQKKGITHVWFAPWDELIRWWNVQEAMMDMVIRPELVHMAMDRLVNAYIARLDQWEDMGLLSATEGNFRVGSGGLAYTDKLPKNQDHVKPSDQWGCSTAQIFSVVSPEMHEEFALQYERRWLARFGLNYYGCCEPLHNKLDILESVPNLRKISMSPWADLEKAVSKIGGNYVLSIKPSPAVFASDNWNIDQAAKYLSETLEKVRGCRVEVIMKDISTVRSEPQRLWQWANMAMEVIERFA